MKHILKKREANKQLYQTLLEQKVNPLVAKLLSARGVGSSLDFTLDYDGLIHYSQMKNVTKMAEILFEAIKTNKKLLIISDYDADGATACVVGYSCLKAFGANVRYLIPKRLVQGYGLTPDIAEIACSEKYKSDYIITVDNGISSFEGIDYCNSQGVEVLVTDHHRAGASLPNAKIIVNPNQPTCNFPSKALAGVGVIFYVMWALQELIQKNNKEDQYFDVKQLLPIVAVGTIADVVSLDTNNRILVKAGLERIKQGKCSEGLKAIIKCANKRYNTLTTTDIAFQIGPRINAVGRLETMDVGVECLLCEESGRSVELAEYLQSTNDERKEVELLVVEEVVKQISEKTNVEGCFSIAVTNEDWHQGVVGIAAGRIKETHWRPTFVFTEQGCEDNQMKGSGRSIPGLNIRDALDEVNTLSPGVLLKFGGHAMAAGATIAADRFDDFRKSFEEVVRRHLTQEQLNQVIEVDGRIPSKFINIADIACIKEIPWGQNFPEPSFADTFEVYGQELIGQGKHLKLSLRKDDKTFNAIMFRQETLVKKYVDIVYKLDINEFRGAKTAQIIIDKIINTYNEKEQQ